MKRASNSDVTNIEVEVDRPSDRARKTDSVRSNTATASISGTGATGTLKTNNSSGDWYLDIVSVSALGATAGTIAVDIQIVDGNGAVVSELTGDVASGYPVDFRGHIIKPGWSIDYVIDQNDSTAYSVDIKPLIRKPSPDTPKTVISPSSIDSFESATPLSNYTGDTADFSVISTDSYHLDHSLELAGVKNKSLYSQEGSGLNAYPEKGDQFSFRHKTTNASVSKSRVACNFALQDSSDYWIIRAQYDDQAMYVLEHINGNTDVVDSYSAALEGGQWQQTKVDWGDTLTFTTYDNDGDVLGSTAVGESKFTNLHTDGGAGWWGSVVTGESVRLDRGIID